jgi:hypothetical protein
VALALVLSAACGNGSPRGQVAGDSGADGVADAPVGDVLQRAPDGSPAADGSDAPAAADGPAGGDDVEAAGPEAGADRPEPTPDAHAETMTDLRAERPSATASWTVAPGPMCTAAGAGCMDTGAVGGYQITASGSCPSASSLQLWFPGGQAQVATGTYAVKAAAGIFDVISMPAGMVGVLAERDDPSHAHFRYWGRSGTVTVAAAGAGRHVTFAGVALREETTGIATTLAADVSCP